MDNYSSSPVDDATPQAQISRATPWRRLASAVMMSFALGAVGAAAVASSKVDDTGGQAVLFEKPTQLVAAASAIDDGLSYTVQTSTDPVATVTSASNGIPTRRSVSSSYSGGGAAGS